MRSRALRGKNLRSRSSALIDGTLKIDLSSDTLHHVLTQGLDMTRVDRLLVTHAHHDHFAVRELQYASWMFVPQSNGWRLQVLCPPDAAQQLADELDLGTLPISVHCLAPWERVNTGPWGITPVLAQHDPEYVCYNYLIERNGRTLLYATDTGWYGEGTWSFLGNVKIDGAVIECTKGLDEGGYRAHLSIPELIRMRERLLENGILKARAPVVTTHHSHLCGLLHEELESHLTPNGIEVGFDGMVFQI